MKAIDAVKFSAKLTAGTRVKGYGNSIYVITGTNKYGWTAYSEYQFEKYGKKDECLLRYETILNPHYSKNLEIID